MNEPANAQPGAGPDAISVLMKIIDERRSVRGYDSRPIPEEHLQTILEAARLAPSSNNTQPWRFIIVRDSEIRMKLASATPLATPSTIRFIAEAPVTLVCCAMPHLLLHRAAGAIEKDYHEIDVAIAVEHMVLAATALGIGTCWVGWFSERKVKKLLGIPRGAKVVALLPLGYPKTVQREWKRPRPPGIGGIPGTPRRPLSELICQERWGFR